MSSDTHRTSKNQTQHATVRLVDNPKDTARFQIQELLDADHDTWKTLRMFSNEHEARNLFATVKEHGLGVRVLDTAKVKIP